jgi:hypothetical protein
VEANAMTDLLTGRAVPVPHADDRSAAQPAPGSARVRGRRLPHWTPLAVVGSVILAAAPVVVWICSVSHPLPVVHDVALFVHLASLLLGFGAVLTVDWVAALFILGRRNLHEMLRAADNAAVPVWAGYAGLVLSGLLLEPDLTSPLTIVKLVLVLVIGLNGVVALGLHRALGRGGADLRWMALGGMCATVSQLCWWGATAVGFLNAH